jgi:hypothetical protein
MKSATYDMHYTNCLKPHQLTAGPCWRGTDIDIQLDTPFIVHSPCLDTYRPIRQTPEYAPTFDSVLVYRVVLDIWATTTFDIPLSFCSTSEYFVRTHPHRNTAMFLPAVETEISAVWMVPSRPPPRPTVHQLPSFCYLLCVNIVPISRYSSIRGWTASYASFVTVSAKTRD